MIRTSAMSGIPTAADRTYRDDLAMDPSLAGFAKKIAVTGDASVTDMQAVGEVTLTDGSIVPFVHDPSARLGGAILETSLRAKAQGLIGDEAEALWNMVTELDRHGAADLGKGLQAK